jgi:hypothetical protein
LANEFIVTGAGDAVVAGAFPTTIVAKLAGATGAIVWEARPRGGVSVVGLGELPSGDVVLLNAVSFVEGLLIVALDGGSGAERWRRTIDNVSSFDGVGFATNPAGQVLIGGQLAAGLPTCYDAFAAALDGETGAILRTVSIDGTTKARLCDNPCLSNDEPGPCPPSRDGIDQDYLRAVAAGRDGKMVLAGALSDGPRGRPHGFVATVAVKTELVSTDSVRRGASVPLAHPRRSDN